MSKKVICVALGALLLAFGFSAEAQQPKKVPLIGFLGATSPSTISDRVEAFRQVCASLGTWRGKTLLSSGGMQRVKLTDYLALPLSWCVSR